MTGISNYNFNNWAPTGNPEADAMRYAQSKGISLDEAKAELRSKFGDPQPPVQQTGYTETGTIDFNYKPQTAAVIQNVPPEQMALLQKGIPAEVIVQGDDAIRKFAQENNITLPAKNETAGGTTVQTSTVNDTEETGKMSRKEAKAWMKAYSQEHKCSKKEAKQAFIDTFGYEVPKRKNILGNILGLVAGAGILGGIAFLGIKHPNYS